MIKFETLGCASLWFKLELTFPLPLSLARTMVALIYVFADLLTTIHPAFCLGLALGLNWYFLEKILLSGFAIYWTLNHSWTDNFVFADLSTTSHPALCMGLPPRLNQTVLIVIAKCLLSLFILCHIFIFMFLPFFFVTSISLTRRGI